MATRNAGEVALGSRKGSRRILTERAMLASATGQDQWIPDGRGAGAGSLYGRITPRGERLYVFRYVGPDGKRVNWPIGEFDARATEPEGMTDEWVLRQRAMSVALARRKAGLLQRLYRNGVRDLRGHFLREQQIADAAQAAELDRIRREADAAEAAAQAARRQAEAEAAAREAAECFTLRALLEAYVRHLERRGKSASYDARLLFKNHVFSIADGPAAKPAKEIHAREVTALLRRLTEAGKGRTAAKLRSYMRAAYALAFEADLNPDAPSELVPFGIEYNPVAPTASLSQYSRARERNLSATELREVLRRAARLPPAQADTIRLALLLGGQRPTQLLRATVADVDLASGRIRLRDPKGRRSQARTHDLPLHGEARTIVKRLLQKAAALGTSWLFTSADVYPERLMSIAADLVEGGRPTAPLRLETVSASISDMSAAMIAEKKAREPFQMRDLRRTCETMLAALGISKDIRAQIQSHGLAGVQARHYDRHDYMDEKIRALQAWEARLGRIERGEPEPKVTEMAEARKRRRRAA